MENKNNNGRRTFIKNLSQAGLVTGLSAAAFRSTAAALVKTDHSFLAEKIPYAQEPLPYRYSALEPAIDAMTMEIHYTKHAAGYARSLAEAVKEEGVKPESTPLEDVLGNISKYSDKMRNNAGGHYNHAFFWKSMGRPGKTLPSGTLMQAIEKDFNSFDAFKIQFADAGKNRFGSGWAWLVMTPQKKLVVGSSPNQANPLMPTSDLKGIPLLALDVWEHAYYLKYQHRRPDYINAWWNVVSWDMVRQRFDAR
jgi:Fe-Mn family superoxide dismutase